MVQWRWGVLIAVVCSGLCARAHAQSTWTGADFFTNGNTDWSDPMNWSPNAAPAGNSAVIFSGSPYFDSTVDQSYTYDSVSFTSLTGILTLSTSTYTIGIGSGDTVSFADGSDVVLNVPIVGQGQLTMSSSLQTGTVYLGAQNTYSGHTTVQYGKLTDDIPNALSPFSALYVGGNGSGTPGVVSLNYDESVPGLFDAAGGPGSVVVGSEATLAITASSAFSGVISGSDGGLHVANGARFELDGNNTYTGNTTIDAASTLAIGDGASISPLTVISGLGSLNFENTGSFAFSNYITDQVSIVQEESGTTTLTGANDFSGNTIITDGALTDGVDNAFSPNSTVLLSSAGTLDIEHSESIPSIGNYNGVGNGIIFIGASGVLNLTSDSLGATSALKGTGTLNMIDEGSLALTGEAANTFTGSINISEGSSFSIGDGGLGAATIMGGGTLNFINTNDTTVTAELGTSSEDNFQVIETGTAKVTLTPPLANHYSGNTSIDASGILADGKDNSFSPNSVVYIDQGGTLEADYNETIAGLADGFNGGSENVSIATGKTLTLNLTNDFYQSFSGIISGGGGLTVTGDGSGLQTLSGVNAYTGGTTVGNAELDLVGATINHPLADLVVADASSDNGTLVLDSGSTVTDHDATIGNQAGSNGSVVVTDPAVVWTTNGTLTVGNAGTGALQIASGLVTDASAVVGNASGSSGLVQVVGGTWTTSGTVTVGNAGNGIIDLADNGIINISGGSGTLTLGSANTGAALFIGQDVLNNVYENQGGVLNAAKVNGTAPSTTIDEIIFDTDKSSESPYYFTNTGASGGTPIEIDGTIHVAIGDSNAISLSSAYSTYSGGTSVGYGSYLLLGASSSGGVPGDPARGPIGMGALTLDNNVTVDTSVLNLTLDNNINLSTGSEQEANFGNQSNSNNLTLTGIITGDAQIGWLSRGTMTLSNGGSTFTGGLYVPQGTLFLTASTTGGGVDVIPTSGPAGTGTISFGDETTLTRPNGASLTISNSFFLANAEGDLPSHLNITGDSSGLFTLSGTLTDVYAEPSHLGVLTISSPVQLDGLDQVGRTIVIGTTLSVESDDGIQDGIVFAQSGAILNIDSQYPSVGSLDLTDSTANFAGGDSNGAVIGDISMTNSTINFADDSHPEIQGLSDNSGSTNVINLNGSDLELILDNGVSGSPINFYGTITGAGSVDIGGLDFGSVVQLNGNNTYSGTTTVENGNVAVAGGSYAFGGYMGTPGTLTLIEGSALVVNSGATLTNPISMADNVFFGGGGTIAPISTPNITIQNGSVITGGTGALGYLYDGIAGNAIGTLTFASTTGVTLAQGGVLQFSIMNDTGSAGSDYSAVNVNGTLTIDSSTATTPFVIQLVGIDGVGPFDGSGVPVSVDFMSPHSWTLLTAGTIVNPGGGFDPSDFQVDTTTYFSGPGTGQWSVSEVGNTLELDFSPVPEPSTWGLMVGGLGILVVMGWRRRCVVRAA